MTCCLFFNLKKKNLYYLYKILYNFQNFWPLILPFLCLFFSCNFNKSVGLKIESVQSKRVSKGLIHFKQLPGYCEH